MEYNIFIPSYQRAKTLKNKTLSLLQKYKVDMSIVTVFVADENEKKEYQKQNPNIRIQVGIKGMKNVRNFMTDQMLSNCNYVFMDDDVEKIVEMDKGREEKELEDFQGLIQNILSNMTKYNCYLGGIYPVPNGYFMKNRINLGLSYIIGSFYIIRAGAKKIYVSVDDKEDFERSLLFYLEYKKNLRHERYSIVSKYYKELGGMQVDRTDQRIKEDAQKLLELYPNRIKLAKSKKGSNKLEIKFKNTV